MGKDSKTNSEMHNSYYTVCQWSTRYLSFNSVKLSSELYDDMFSIDVDNVVYLFCVCSFLSILFLPFFVVEWFKVSATAGRFYHSHRRPRMLTEVWVRIPTGATCCKPISGSYHAVWTLYLSDIIYALLGK